MVRQNFTEAQEQPHEVDFLRDHIELRGKRSDPDLRVLQARRGVAMEALASAIIIHYPSYF